jgi:hypothetical protein
MFNFRIFFYLLFLNCVSLLSDNAAVKQLNDNIELSNVDLAHEVVDLPREIEIEEDDGEDDENNTNNEEKPFKKQLSLKEESSMDNTDTDVDTYTEEDDSEYDDEEDPEE